MEAFVKILLGNTRKLPKHVIKLQNFFGIPKRLVFPWVSYTEEETRNCGIDLLAYKILQNALQNAIDAHNNIRERGDEFAIPEEVEETTKGEIVDRC